MRGMKNDDGDCDSKDHDERRRDRNFNPPQFLRSRVSERADEIFLEVRSSDQWKRGDNARPNHKHEKRS